MYGKILLLAIFLPEILTGPVSPSRSYVALEEDENRMSYILVETSEGTYEVEDLTRVRSGRKASQSDVTYYFYSQDNEEGQIVNVSSSDIPDTFDPTKTVLLLIHGWRNNYNSSFNTLIRSAVLEQFDTNVIVTDWSSIAEDDYLTAKKAVPAIGEFVGEFMENLTTTYNISLSNVSIVGHSLGAHVSGIVGSYLQSEVSHIVGLDPAAPLISTSNKNHTLDASDALFVQVIHTSGGILGLLTSLGHTDYFPNGGIKQPGCGLDVTGSCAHGRSYRYYAESIRSGNFTSQQCSSYATFLIGTCDGEYSLMGGYDLDESSSGDFYLDTNKESPYAEGNNSTSY